MPVEKQQAEATTSSTCARWGKKKACVKTQQMLGMRREKGFLL
jgi:hypothetical protein